MIEEYNDNEYWLKVPDFDGWYEVSNLGRIRSYQNFGHQKRKTPIILKPNLDRYGYLCLTLCNKGKHKQVTIHSIVAKAFLPKPSPNLQIDHINGIKTDNRVENLEWVTAKENTLRSVANGLKPRGERHRNHKLTQENVYEIRRLYKTGDYTYSKIAEMFKVSKTVIRDIIKNKTWADDNVKFDRKGCEGV